MSPKIWPILGPESRKLVIWQALRVQEGFLASWRFSSRPCKARLKCPEFPEGLIVPWGRIEPGTGSRESRSMSSVT